MASTTVGEISVTSAAAMSLPAFVITMRPEETGASSRAERL